MGLDTRKSKFTTHLGMNMKSTYSKYARDKRALKRVPREVCVSLDTEMKVSDRDNKSTCYIDTVSSNESVESEIVAQEILDELRLLAEINNIDGKLIDLILCGKKQTEIGKELGESQVQISRILKRILKQYKALENYDRWGKSMELHEIVGNIERLMEKGVRNIDAIAKQLELPRNSVAFYVTEIKNGKADKYKRMEEDEEKNTDITVSRLKKEATDKEATDKEQEYVSSLIERCNVQKKEEDTVENKVENKKSDANEDKRTEISRSQLVRMLKSAAYSIYREMCLNQDIDLKNTASRYSLNAQSLYLYKNKYKRGIQGLEDKIVEECKERGIYKVAEERSLDICMLYALYDTYVADNTERNEEYKRMCKQVGRKPVPTLEEFKEQKKAEMETESIGEVVKTEQKVSGTETTEVDKVEKLVNKEELVADRQTLILQETTKEENDEFDLELKMVLKHGHIESKGKKVNMQICLEQGTEEDLIKIRRAIDKFIESNKKLG